jgi:pimeloyl-ACP methyl ester carboxylesterase
MRIGWVGFLMTLGAWGCAAAPVNPSFPLTTAEAHRAIAQMRANRRELQRPLVLIGGFADPAVAANYEEWFFGGVSKHAVLIPVSIGFCNSFAECREKVIAAVDAACPDGDPKWTAEVDVVGVSLGGLVARYAAAPSLDPAHPRRLRIARLFSISSPQSGAKLAETAGFTEFHREIRPGSEFLRSLAASDAQASYQIYPYTHLNDDIVGEVYSAPPGMTPYWLASDSVLLSHSNAMADDRILADIARRLRDEKPFSTYPPAPLPGAKKS